jgi:hypothetical protein
MARKIYDYKIFGNHAYYTPGISGMIALFGWFILGSIVGSVLAALLTPIGMGDYAFMLAYVVSFIPAMMFAASRGVRNAGFDTGYVLDNNNFAPVNGWVLAAMVIVGTLAMSYIMPDLLIYHEFSFVEIQIVFTRNVCRFNPMFYKSAHFL